MNPTFAAVLSATLFVAVATEDELPDEAKPPPREDAPATAPVVDEEADAAEASAQEAYLVELGLAFERENEAVQGCARPRAGQSWVEGAILLAWRVDPEGAPSDATVEEDSTGRAEIGVCLTQLVETLRFPPPPRGKEVVVKRRFDVVAPQGPAGFFNWLSGLFGCG